jgi:hypothetical protein
MRYITCLLSSLLVSILMSCGPKGNEAHIAQLDSLLVLVDTCQLRFERIQKDVPVDSLFDLTTNQMDLVTEIYTDSTDQEFWVVTMSDYYAAHKVIKRIKNRRESLNEEIGICRKQIEDLKHDERKGLVPQEKSIEYFERELMAVQALQENVNLLYESAYSAEIAIDTLTPIIQSKLEQALSAEIK